LPDPWKCQMRPLQFGWPGDVRRSTIWFGGLRIAGLAGDESDAAAAFFSCPWRNAVKLARRSKTDASGGQQRIDGLFRCATGPAHRGACLDPPRVPHKCHRQTDGAH
jgi:hypothetical protein